MLLNIKPSKKNIYPVKGILIKSKNVQEWISEIQLMGLSLNSSEIFPIPDQEVNSIWGCLVTFQEDCKPKDIRKNSYCQCIQNRIFIPEYTFLYPHISTEEINSLFKSNLFILHSDSGLVELQEIINWSDLICIPEYTTIQITSPADSTRIPAVIKSFQISPISPDEVIKQLEESSFPERKNLEHKPLSISEKIKLQTLRLLFQRKKIDNNSHSDKKPESTILLEKLQNCLSFWLFWEMSESKIIK